jgi:hypothetical protein
MDMSKSLQFNGIEALYVVGTEHVSILPYCSSVCTTYQKPQKPYTDLDQVDFLVEDLSKLEVIDHGEIRFGGLPTLVKKLLNAQQVKVRYVTDLTIDGKHEKSITAEPSISWEYSNKESTGVSKNKQPRFFEEQH